MTDVKPERVLIGWTEMVDLPEWGIKRLRAKVDTGARTSALHVENIREIARDQVSFDVVLHRAKRDRRVHVKAPILRRGRVRSSNGHQSNRIFVQTRIALGPVTQSIEVSLVDREHMVHRMLLGREALSGRFLIDVDRRLLQSRSPKRKKKKATRKHRSMAET
jgi:hypothetical protein